MSHRAHKIAFQARKVIGTFEKRAPGHQSWSRDKNIAWLYASMVLVISRYLTCADFSVHWTFCLFLWNHKQNCKLVKYANSRIFILYVRQLLVALTLSWCDHVMAKINAFVMSRNWKCISLFRVVRGILAFSCWLVKLICYEILKVRHVENSEYNLLVTVRFSSVFICNLCNFKRKEFKYMFA